MATSKKTTKKKTIKKAAKSTLKVSVYDLLGKAKGSVELPKELFDTKVNEDLMTQAVHVYRTNQRRGTVAQKTRGEVRASTRKIYRQKGTGRARHGALSAPIFVGGGVTFAGKPREFAKKLTRKMRIGALSSALTTKAKADSVKVVDFEKAKGKTQEIAAALKGIKTKGSILLLTDGKNQPLRRAARNIQGLTVLPANNANTYEVLKNKNVLVTKEGLDIMKAHFLKMGKESKS